MEALDLDNASQGQHLADLFLSKGIVEVHVDSNPIHMNVTVPPGTGTTSASGASQTLPAEPSGVILAPNEQTGSVINLLENPQSPPANLDGPTFEIGGSSQSGTTTS